MINECHELKTALLILIKLGLIQVIKTFELQTEKGEFHLHIPNDYCMQVLHV